MITDNLKRFREKMDAGQVTTGMGVSLSDAAVTDPADGWLTWNGRAIAEDIQAYQSQLAYVGHLVGQNGSQFLSTKYAAYAGGHGHCGMFRVAPSGKSVGRI